MSEGVGDVDKQSGRRTVVFGVVELLGVVFRVGCFVLFYAWGLGLLFCLGEVRDIAVRGDTNLLTRAYPQQIVRQAYSHAYRTPSNTNRL